MKRSLEIPLFLCLLMVEAAVCFIVSPRVATFHSCSEVYKKYAHSDHIKAVYIKDYNVSDSTTIAVTMLVAQDSLGWAVMSKDFNIPPLSELEKEATRPDEDLSFLRQVNKQDYSQRIAGFTENTESMIVAPQDKKLCIFHTQSKSENLEVSHYYFRIMTE